MYDVTLGPGLERLEKNLSDLVARLSNFDEFIFPNSQPRDGLPDSRGGALGDLEASLSLISLAQSIMKSIEEKSYWQDEVPAPRESR